MSNLAIIQRLVRSFIGAFGRTPYVRSTSIKTNKCNTPNIGNINLGKSFQKINFLYTNATSLVNKWSDFNSLIAFHNCPHVILITETWFTSSSICQVANYKSFFRHRDIVRGGGVAIYVRCDLESFDVCDMSLCNTRSEQVWCRVKLNKETLLIGCIYRPPFADSEINFEISKSIGYASHLCSTTSSKNLIVAGDFNFPDIVWTHDGGYCPNKGRPSSLEFLNTLSSNYLSQHVLEPTFKNNILDLVITNDPARVFSVFHGPPLGSTLNDCLHATLTWSHHLRSTARNHSDPPLRQVLSLGNY